MNAFRLIRLIVRNIWYLLLIPLIAAGIMFAVTHDQPRLFTARASIFTAITSSSSLDDMGDSRVDYFATKTDYNNMLSILNSRNVQEETALRLLASHLVLKGAQADVISDHSLRSLHEIMTDDVRALIVPGNTEQTYLRLRAYLQHSKDNFVYGLLNFDQPYYSYKAMSTIKAVQDGGSDIVVLTYQCADAAIAYNTLRIFIDVFLDKYGELKKNQTSAVVQYFEDQISRAATGLSEAEDRLLEFNKSNNIINYYEQTKHISSQQEKIEVKLQDELMELSAEDAVLKKLEAETASRFKINLKNKDILDIRQSLIAVNQQLAAIELDSTVATARKEQLSVQKDKLELRLKGQIDSLYIYQHNSDGIDIKSLLADWLATVIRYESARARTAAMQDKQKEFEKLYVQYAPLGSVLKRIEREIDVKEKEYLEILHHLGLAKLKQQNEEMQANMKILDRPQLPLDPEPSKRKLYVAIIAVASLVLTLLGMVVFDLIDKTIRSTEQLAALTGASPAGAIGRNTAGEYSDEIARRALTRIVNELLALRGRTPAGQALTVQLLSNWQGEGKSYLLGQIQRQLSESGYRVGSISVGGTGADIDISLLQSYQCQAYCDIPGTGDGTCQIYIAEHAALAEYPFNPNLLASAHASYFIADAGRTWGSADANIFAQLSNGQIPNLKCLVNNACPDEVETYLGDLPKHRSAARIFIKKHIVKRFFA